MAKQSLRCLYCGHDTGSITLTGNASIEFSVKAGSKCLICGESTQVEGKMTGKDEGKNISAEWGGNLMGFNSKGEIINCADHLNRREKEK